MASINLFLLILLAFSSPLARARVFELAPPSHSPSPFPSHSPSPSPTPTLTPSPSPSHSSPSPTPTPTPSPSPSHSSPSPTPTPSPSPSPSHSYGLHADHRGKNFTYVCDPARMADLGFHVKNFQFCNKELSYEQRAKDLVRRMTVEEKVVQLGDAAYGVKRLGLPPYKWWSEALHGVSNVGPGTKFNKSIVGAATNFPVPILTAAAFNESLWKTIGQAVSTEARAMYNLGIAGLTFWSPNINVIRDPRWGRITETPGEDPYLTGRYAVNYVRGLQDVEGYEHVEDKKSRPLKVSSCCKHYAAYDVDEWLGVDRYHFDARAGEQDMVETFLKPFEMCVKDGDVSSVMCSYNKVNGIPACADPRLLAQTIRDEWGLNGYIVSDCDSIEVMHHGHKWLDDEPEDAVAQVLRAGLDLDCGQYYTKYTLPAIQKSRVQEKEVDKALVNLYVVLMRLGIFDGSPGKYDNLGKKDVCSKQHTELAIDAAREGIVLLKNLNSTLPLKHADIDKIALVGPHANASKAMIGNYAGIPCRYITPLDAFSKYGKVMHREGCGDMACKNDTLIYPAVIAGKHADVTIILAGTDLSIEAESRDRIDLNLPGYQKELITQVAAAATKPVVLVLLTAGGVDVSFAQKNPKISAIVWAGFPGSEGGRAIADVIFGHTNPSGKLPITWYYNNYIEKLPMTSMQLRPVEELKYPGRTYKFFNGKVLYPFGHGLSYTNFTLELTSSTRFFTTKLGPLQHCKHLNVSDVSVVRSCPSVPVDDLQCNSTIDFEVEVKNDGRRDGSHTLIVYSSPPSDLLDAPLKQVVDFKKVFVHAGNSTTAKFSLNVCKGFNVVTKSAYIVLPSGQHTITVGQKEDHSWVSFPVNIDYEN